MSEINTAQARETVGEAFARFYGQDKRARESASSDYVDARISLDIGFACMQLRQGRVKQAEQTLDTARFDFERLRPMFSDPSRLCERTNVLFLGHCISVIKRRRSPGQLQRLGQAIHRTAAAELSNHLEAYNALFVGREPNISARGLRRYIHRNGAKYRGPITELTQLSLLTARPDQRRLILPSSRHFDRSHSSSSNFDHLLVETSPEDEAAFYRIQLKSACIGICGAARRGEKSTLAYWTNQYDNNVRLVSGHCDLGITNDPALPPEDIDPLAYLLVKPKDTLTGSEAHTLDMAANELFHSIKYDDFRRGTHGPTMSYEASIAA